MRYSILFAFALLAAPQEPPFQVQSQLVSVPVTVTDRKGRFVDGLEPSDFKLLDNGRPQRIVVDDFGTGVAPIALVVAVQSSGISVPVLEKVQKIGAMLEPLIIGRRGCAALVSFDERVQWHQECTNNAELIARAFHRLAPGEAKSARMLDAVDEAVERLKKRPNVRRVLFLISESRDRGSETTLDAAIMAAESAGVTIYASTYSAFKTAFTSKPSKAEPPPPPAVPPPARTEPLGPLGRVPIPQPEQRVDILGGLGELTRLGKEKATEVLAEKTGGRTFTFGRQKGLENTIESLAGELHSQYLLSFTPERPAPGLHQLEVRITRRGDYRIRGRKSYWAVQP